MSNAARIITSQLIILYITLSDRKHEQNSEVVATIFIAHVDNAK